MQPMYLSYEDAVKMSTQQLRRYILEQGIGKGTAVAYAAKAQCMAWATGSKPFDPTAVKPEPKPEPDTPDWTAHDDAAEEPAASTDAAAAATPDLGAILAALVQSHIKVQNLDMKQVEAIVKAEVEKATLPTTIMVEFKTETHEVKGLFHKEYKDLLKLAAMNLDPNLARKKNIWMVGPAGGGKTTAAGQVAESLGLRFGAKSMGLHTTKAEIFGQCYADGVYKATEFREIFENGGLFIFDECDRANPNLMTQLNAALENRFCSFPDKTVTQHESCICIAGNNSFGRGSDGNYVGCQQQDASALDRWIFFEWNYDEKLERKLANNDAWVDRVQAIRKVVFDKREKVIVSPRASYHGADLLNAGFLQSKVEEMVIWKGINKEVKQRIMAEL